MKKSHIFIGCIILLAMVLGFSTYVRGAILVGKAEPTAATTGKTTITVNSVTASTKDENIIVPIKIENNTGICGATLTISYDKNLVLKDIATGTGFSSLTMTKPGKYSENPINILWDGIEPDKTNGEIAVLTFTSPKKAGTYNIEIANKKVIDGDLNPVEVVIANGSVTIKSDSSETTAEETTVAPTTEKETTAEETTMAPTTEKETTAEETTVAPTTEKETTEAETTVEESEEEESTEYSCEVNGHVGGEATCIDKAVCYICGQEYGELDPTNHQGKTQVKNAKKKTCKKAGYTGDIYCKDCGALIKKGKKIAASHTWGSWKTVKSATVFVKGKRTRTCKVCKTKYTQTVAKLKPTIKLSATKKTIKKRKTYTLVVSKLAKGDYVKSVSSGYKKVATVRKIAKNKYRITATSRKGKATIRVTLASGKKATCTVTVK